MNSDGRQPSRVFNIVYHQFIPHNMSVSSGSVDARYISIGCGNVKVQ